MAKRRTSKDPTGSKVTRKRTGTVLEPAPAGPLASGPLVSASASNVLPLFPGFVPDYEWVLGLVVTSVRPGVRALPPVAALFLEAGSGTVIHVDPLSSMSPQSVGATVRRALERGQALGLRMPTRIRVGAPAQVELLDEAIGRGIEVVVGHTPEVDEAMRTPGALRGLAGPPIDDVDAYRGIAAIADARLAAFFRVAAAFGGSAPWRLLGRHAPLRMRIPALGLPSARMGFLPSDPRKGLEVRAEPGDAEAWIVAFVPPSRLSRVRRAELRDLPFRPKTAGPVPVLRSLEADGELRAAKDSDYVLAIAAMLATCRLVAEYGPVLRRRSLRSLAVRYEVEAGGEPSRVEVELGFPAGP